MTTILRKEKDGLFLYRGENWPEMPKIYSCDKQTMEMVILEDRGKWFLSCERSGNRWRVPISQEKAFRIWAYGQNTTDHIIWHNNENDWAMIFPNDCCEIRESKTVQGMTAKGIESFSEKMAFFKSPEQSQENEDESVIASIAERIRSEYSKHKELDWSRIAAQKIYSSFKITLK